MQMNDTLTKPLTTDRKPQPRPGPTPHIALVDEDGDYRETLAFNLEGQGFEVSMLGRGPALLDRLVAEPRPDLILLAWRPPGMEGPETLRRLRDAGAAIPVIILTPQADPLQEETALTGGAVDYVETTRSLAVLLRRMRLILDRVKEVREPAPLEMAEAEAQPPYCRGALELRTDVARAFWQGQRIDLTLTEFNMVQMMAMRAGRDVAYRELYDLVHGKDFVAGVGPAGYRANVRAFIKRIRAKFRAIDPTFDGIGNYPGFGYRWTDLAAGETNAAA